MSSGTDSRARGAGATATHVVPLFARVPVFGAALAMAVALTASSNGYGYHRDELYFRMLRPAWGYVDQPPLTPLLARLLSGVVDQPWAMRMPATLAAASSVVVVALITRELGGTRAAQTLCAWAYAFAASPLLFGHVLLTSSLDLLVWPTVTLLVLRALMRDRPAWWLAAGAVVGVSTYNKLLIGLLLVSLALGLLAVGPRRVLWDRWALAGVALATALAAPNVFYQVTHGWPQLTMGRALSENNADEVRVLMWPFLLLLLGPPLVPVWLSGWWVLLRRRSWRRVRFLGVAFPMLLLLTFVAGAQQYYPFGLLVVLFAAGCVPTADLVARSRPWRTALRAAVVLNAVVAAVIALPLLPLSALGRSPVPAVSQVAADQVGWPAYVRQVASAARSLSPQEARSAVIFTSNYGEAGAVARYGPALGLARPYSGHNQLGFEQEPPDGTDVVVFVGAQLGQARRLFASCEVVARLDNGVGVDNEEQGQPVAVCRAPTLAWTELWPRLRHYD